MIRMKLLVFMFINEWRMNWRMTRIDNPETTKGH
jgi:hypothetical protein